MTTSFGYCLSLDISLPLYYCLLFLFFYSYIACDWVRMTCSVGNGHVSSHPDSGHDSKSISLILLYPCLDLCVLEVQP